MIDTATISEQAANWTDTALIVATLVLGILFALVYAAWGARNDFSVPRVVVPAVGIPSLALIVLLSLTPAGEKILVFDNNTGSVQAIEGEKPIIQVLERSKTKVVSVPCIFVTDKGKQRHDCTFVSLGEGSFEVWDTTTFRQTHPRS